MLGGNVVFRWISFSPYLYIHVTKRYPFRQEKKRDKTRDTIYLFFPRLVAVVATLAHCQCRTGSDGQPKEVKKKCNNENEKSV
jgi:hypothetical protein